MNDRLPDLLTDRTAREIQDRAVDVGGVRQVDQHISDVDHGHADQHVQPDRLGDQAAVLRDDHTQRPPITIRPGVLSPGRQRPGVGGITTSRHEHVPGLRLEVLAAHR